MQSAYHNLPTINGYMQKDGAVYGAADTCTVFSDTVCEIQMNIAPAYPSEANLEHYIRTASLSKDEGICICDDFDFIDGCNDSKKHGGSNAISVPKGNDVILSFMTYEKPVLIQQSDTLLFQIGALGSLIISGAEYMKTECIPITDARLKTAWQHEIYRILIRAERNFVRIRA